VSARIAPAFAGLALAALLLAGCASPLDGHTPSDGPTLSDDQGDQPASGLGASPNCESAFPSATERPDLAKVAGIVPADFPEPPTGSELCIVLKTNDVNAVLQYATPSSPDAVIEYYQGELTGYEIVVSDGIGGNPILNATSPDLEFAIQTDAATGTYFVAFEVL
jgi:hypothetical protein